MRNIKDLTGKTFGLLTVISRGPNTSDRKVTWDCLCSCGNSHRTTSYNLEKGCTKSCGCIRKKRAIKLKTTHGDSKSKEFKAWVCMRNRCYNQRGISYHDYGGRGITVCEQWIHSYLEFLSHVGRAPTQLHSIDRINNNGNYEPGNVKWSTPKEQASNRRKRKDAIPIKP